MGVLLLVFFYVMGLLITGMAILLAVAITRLWLGLRVSSDRLVRGWLIAALGFALELAVFRTWTSRFLGGPDVLGLPSWFLADAVSVVIGAGWSALVAFGVLRLRARGAWLFFAILASVMISLAVPMLG